MHIVLSHKLERFIYRRYCIDVFFGFILMSCACLLCFSNWFMSYGSMPDSCSTFFLLQKAKKSYQKDLENSQRNVDGDTSSAPGDGCVWLYCFIYINNSVHSLV